MKLTQEMIEEIQELMNHTKKDGTINWQDGDDIRISLGGTFAADRFIVIKNEDITLLSPHEVPELYDAWGSDEFDDLYEKAERKLSVKKTKINAQELFFDILKERAETGRIYIMNIDHCNTHSSFKDRVTMSNLCQEITLPTTPIQHIDGEGEIALCILSAINVGKINKRDELEPLCDLAVCLLYTSDAADDP